jgi:hypothetical protein
MAGKEIGGVVVTDPGADADEVVDHSLVVPPNCWLPNLPNKNQDTVKNPPKKNGHKTQRPRIQMP